MKKSYSIEFCPQKSLNKDHNTRINSYCYGNLITIDKITEYPYKNFSLEKYHKVFQLCVKLYYF